MTVFGGGRSFKLFSFAADKTWDLTSQHGYRSFRKREHGLRIRQNGSSHGWAIGIGVAVRTIVDPLVLLAAEGYDLDQTIKAQLAPIIKHDPDRMRTLLVAVNQHH